MMLDRIENLKDAKRRLSKELDGKDPDQVQKFVEGMELWVRGSIEWMFDTERELTLVPL